MFPEKSAPLAGRQIGICTVISTTSDRWSTATEKVYYTVYRTVRKFGIQKSI